MSLQCLKMAVSKHVYIYNLRKKIFFNRREQIDDSIHLGKCLPKLQTCFINLQTL